MRNNSRYGLSDEEKSSTREMWKILLGHRVGQVGEQTVYNEIMKPLLPAERIQFGSFKDGLIYQTIQYFQEVDECKRESLKNTFKLKVYIQEC